MSMTIGAVIASMNVAKSIAAYFGLVESASADITSLVHQAFKSAVMNLELAKTSSQRTQCEEYLKEARNKFVEAIAVEKDESLVSAFMGLAMCQYLLGDSSNAVMTIDRIACVQLSSSEKMKARVKSYAKGNVFGPIIGMINAYNGAKERESNFVEFKNKVISEIRCLK